MKGINLLIVLMVLFFACNPQTKTSEDTLIEPDVYENVIPELKACLEAHGGLKKWRSFGSLEYDRATAKGGGDHSIIDLRNRKDLVKNDTAYTVGFDGTDAWITPGKDAMRSAPRFFHNLYFYFFALPFVVADPGTNQEFIGQKTFNGLTYNKIKITYGENVGDSPEDQYILWVNAQTNQLDFINYSVTYFDKSRAEKYNALVYSDWKDIDGLKVPTILTSYRWEEDTLGDVRGSNTFSNILFSERQPDQAIFQVPEGAYLDALPVKEEE